MIERCVGREAASPPLLWDHLVGGAFEVTPRTRVVTGHFAGLLPLWLGKWPRTATVLRSPVARALSHVNHVQRDESHPLHRAAAGLSVAEYCAHPELRRTVDNYQSRYLASLDFSLALLADAPGQTPRPAGHALDFDRALFALDPATGLRDAAARALGAIDAVGICEDDARTPQLIARTFGWDPGVAGGERPRLNTAASGQKTLDSLTDAEVEVLSDLNRIDLATYEAAKEVFERQCQRHGVGAAAPPVPGATSPRAGSTSPAMRNTPRASACCFAASAPSAPRPGS